MVTTARGHSRVVERSLRRILVADGEQDLLAAVEFTLRSAGYDVECVLDGATALAVALAEEFDLVILDARLPRLSGVEVCRRLRAQSNVPIVIQTVLDDEGARLRHLEAGADDYLVRPVPLTELVRRVGVILDGSPHMRS